MTNLTNVLLVDDDLTVRQSLEQALSQEAFRVVSAANGQEALSQLDLHTIDVVLLDLSVPGDLSGTEAVDRLGALDPGVKTILMSGFAQHPAVTEYRMYGFKAVITKPFTLQELSATLHSVITPRESVH